MSHVLRYGQELVLDLYGCDNRFSVETVLRFFEHLCPLLRMKPYKVYFWSADELPVEEIPEIVHGMSAVQFILTSSITVHTADKYGLLMLNIFSCGEFDPQAAINFSMDWFKAKSHVQHLIQRGVMPSGGETWVK